MINTSVAILAGGLATRLYPVTETYPKSLIEINGVPFIKHQLKLLKSKGIENIVLCLGKFSQQVVNYVESEKIPGINVTYSFDGDTLLGTGGAIKKCLDKLTDPFGVLYGDSFLNIDYIDIIEYFDKLDKQGLMSVIRNDNKWDKSNVVFEDNIIVKYDKNGGDEYKFIDYGFNMLRKSTFSEYNDISFDLKNVLQKLIINRELAGYEVSNRFYEIGSFDGIKETENYIKTLNL